MTVITTSKGPVNLDTVSHVRQFTDQGEPAGWRIGFIGGDAVTLSLSEGQALVDWLADRSILDTVKGTK